MTSDQFSYWLQGFVELHGQPPTPAQWEVIKEHAELAASIKKTPDILAWGQYINNANPLCGSSPIIPPPVASGC